MARRSPFTRSLKRLDDAALGELLTKAEAHEGRDLPLTAEAREAMIALADGDGRYLLTMAETLLNIGSAHPLSTAELGQILQKRSPAYDKAQKTLVPVKGAGGLSPAPSVKEGVLAMGWAENIWSDALG